MLLNGCSNFRLAKRALLSATCWVAAWPVFGGIVINEIHYHPASEDVREEFVELHNTDGEAVSLDGWSLHSGVRFDFGPPGERVPAGCVPLFKIQDRSTAFLGVQVPGTASVGRIKNNDLPAFFDFTQGFN